MRAPIWPTSHVCGHRRLSTTRRPASIWYISLCSPMTALSPTTGCIGPMPTKTFPTWRESRRCCLTSTLLPSIPTLCRTVQANTISSSRRSRRVRTRASASMYSVICTRQTRGPCWMGSVSRPRIMWREPEYSRSSTAAGA